MTSKNVWVKCVLGLLLALPLTAQGDAGGPATEPVPAKKERAPLSDAGRAALNSAKDLAGKVRGLRGPERGQALLEAASAYDKVVADHQGEPAVAAIAAITAADLWRQQGSLGLAEKDYLLAAQFEPSRYGQRGLLGAADMQRRQQRRDEALATYNKAAAIDPDTRRAQQARLWQARLLQQMEKLDEAIASFQAALESADPGTETVEAANFLALAWVQKGDFDSASAVIEHAEQVLQNLGDEDPIVVERLKKQVETMSAKKALQRARDKATGAGKDAIGLDRARRDEG
jgi:tetratricopeptide (TPR) repeat protein